MNEAEDYRDIELKAHAMSAKIATFMVRYPSSRWALRLFLNLYRWVARQCDDNLRDDGWR